MTKSPKEEALDRRLVRDLKGPALKAARILIADPEVKHMQDYANTVSIRRLHFNDHGPVHMKTVALYAVQMIEALSAARILLNLEEEGIGTIEDSRVAVLLAACLHDIGMTIGRERHEFTGAHLGSPLIDRILAEVYPDDLNKRVILRSIAIEGINGHMGTQKIHSLEAGLILVADGCDMEKGRARIPMMLATSAQVGDIHKYSANAIERVTISHGTEKPIRIHVDMTASVGFFQVEEILLRKVGASPVKPHIESTLR